MLRRTAVGSRVLLVSFADFRPLCPMLSRKDARHRFKEYSFLITGVWSLTTNPESPILNSGEAPIERFLATSTPNLFRSPLKDPCSNHYNHSLKLSFPIFRVALRKPRCRVCWLGTLGCSAPVSSLTPQDSLELYRNGSTKP